jgi:hypothetical protein
MNVRGKCIEAKTREAVVQRYKALRAAGSVKTWAHELGITPRAVRTILEHYRLHGELRFENVAGLSPLRHAPRSKRSSKQREV